MLQVLQFKREMKPVMVKKPITVMKPVTVMREVAVLDEAGEIKRDAHGSPIVERREVTEEREVVEHTDVLEHRAVDYVLLAPVGEDAQNTQPWRRVKGLRPPEDASASRMNSQSYKVMKARWDEVIGPAYEAWCEGYDIPEDGTPLEAWGAITADIAAILRKHGIKTVEGVRDMGEGMVPKLPIPNARRLPELARMYLDSATRDVMAQEKAAMEARIAQLEALVAAEKPEDKPKRGPGRPRKDEAEAAA